jgi:hypothetical protein
LPTLRAVSAGARFHQSAVVGPNAASRHCIFVGSISLPLVFDFGDETVERTA